TGFVWERHYRSGWNQQDGPCGHGYRHFYQRKLTLYRKRAVYETHDGELMAIERSDDGSFVPSLGFRLEGDGRYFQLETDRDETLVFELQPNTTPRSARLTGYTTANVDINLYYDSRGSLRALSEFSAGLVLDTQIEYDADGHVVQVVRGARGQIA